MFASHPRPRTASRSVDKQIASEKLTGKATVEARYKQNITFDAKPITEIAIDVDGAAGLASGDKKKDDDKKARRQEADEPKKKGLRPRQHHGGGKQAQSSASRSPRQARAAASPIATRRAAPTRTRSA